VQAPVGFWDPLGLSASGSIVVYDRPPVAHLWREIRGRAHSLRAVSKSRPSVGPRWLHTLASAFMLWACIGLPRARARKKLNAEITNGRREIMALTA